jgi:myosin-9
LQRIVGTKVFGVPLQNLVGQDEKIPVFMDNLIHLIETHGFYTEGIYRKSGAQPKINLLKTTLDSGKTGKNTTIKVSFQGVGSK